MYRCRVCQSDYREGIEGMVGDGMRYRDVAREFLDCFECDLHALEQSIATHCKRHLPEPAHELTEKELELLERFRLGKVETDEMSRLVAVKVFEKILRNPDDIKFIDFFRMEMLKIKRKEQEDRSRNQQELINRFFSGKLPANCSDCGSQLFQ